MGCWQRKSARQRGHSLDDAPLNVKVILSMAGRSFWREIVKLIYFLPRLFGILLLSALLGLIPVVGWVVGMMLTLLWAAWNMAIQFIDYPADNQVLNFPQTIEVMRKQRTQCLGFGAMIAGLLSIPLLNLFILPTAVIAATTLWVDELYQEST